MGVVFLCWNGKGFDWADIKIFNFYGKTVRWTVFRRGVKEWIPLFPPKKSLHFCGDSFFIWNGKGFDWYFLRKYQSSFALWFVGSFGFSTRQSLVLTHSLGWLSRYSVRIRRNRHSAPIIFSCELLQGYCPQHILYWLSHHFLIKGGQI